MDEIRTKALELAAQAGGDPSIVVTRAAAYHTFLMGVGVDVAATKTTAAAAADSKVVAEKAAKVAAEKAAKVAAEKAAKVAAAAEKAASAPGTTTKAAAGKTAATKAPTAAAAAAPPGNTKDPKGVHDYNEVVAALQKVMRSVPNDNEKRDAGRKLAYDILAAKGDGVKGVRDLKPPLYDAVVAGCEEALKPKEVPAAAPEDELGDPPEETGGGVPADGEDL